MKYCTNCGNSLADEAAVCPACGAASRVVVNQAAAPVSAPTPVPVPVKDPCDHTEEFDPAEVSEHKPMALLIYLVSLVGIIVALLSHSDSKYLKFHIRQGLKLLVASLTISLVMGVGVVINIIPVVGWIIYGLAALASAVALATLAVLQIMCFVWTCQGKSKEPPILSKLGFLK